MKAFRSVGVFTLSLLFLLFAGMWCKVWIDSRACYLSGERHLGIARAHGKPSEYQEALFYYLESVRCFTPENAYNRKALERAMGIGKHLEDAGKPAEAVQIYCRVQSTLLSLGLFRQPFSDVLHETDLRVRRLLEQ